MSVLIFITDIHHDTKLFSFPERFDLELENWGVGVNECKEIALLKNFVDWTEDWEKEK